MKKWILVLSTKRGSYRQSKLTNKFLTATKERITLLHFSLYKERPSSCTWPLWPLEWMVFERQLLRVWWWNRKALSRVPYVSERTRAHHGALLTTSDGSGRRFFGLGRARALHTRARARVGPQPDFEAIYRAGSGFAFSGSGRARARAKNTVLAVFGLVRPRRSDLRSPGAPKLRSLGKFWLQSRPRKVLPSTIFWHSN